MSTLWYESTVAYVTNQRSFTALPETVRTFEQLPIKVCEEVNMDNEKTRINPLHEMMADKTNTIFRVFRFLLLVLQVQLVEQDFLSEQLEHSGRVEFKDAVSPISDRVVSGCSRVTVLQSAADWTSWNTGKCATERNSWNTGLCKGATDWNSCNTMLDWKLKNDGFCIGETTSLASTSGVN